MLTAITIKNFTLVEQLEIDFCQGMTAITGETGAGKSLVLGALSMALGDRADTDRIRRGAERAEVSALFDISSITPASQWLIDQDFENTGSEPASSHHHQRRSLSRLHQRPACNHGAIARAGRNAD
ncbi:MAG: AAA family ATPase [Porticoccaceae bacterium]